MAGAHRDSRQQPGEILVGRGLQAQRPFPFLCRWRQRLLLADQAARGCRWQMLVCQLRARAVVRLPGPLPALAEVARWACWPCLPAGPHCRAVSRCLPACSLSAREGKKKEVSWDISLCCPPWPCCKCSCNLSLWRSCMGRCHPASQSRLGRGQLLTWHLLSLGAPCSSPHRAPTADHARCGSV